MTRKADAPQGGVCRALTRASLCFRRAPRAAPDDARTLRRPAARFGLAEVDREPKVGQPVPSGRRLRVQGDPGGAIGTCEDVQLDSAGGQAAGDEPVARRVPVSHEVAMAGVVRACGAETIATPSAALRDAAGLRTRG